MLTKQDLEAIDKLLDKRLSLQEEKVAQKFQKLTDMVEDLEIRLDEKASEITMDQFGIKAEFRNEIKNVKRMLNKMYKSQETIIGFFNVEYLKLENRVTKLEQELKLPSPN